MNRSSPRNAEEHRQSLIDPLSSSHSSHNMTLNNGQGQKERGTENLLFDSENLETKELIGFGRFSAVYHVVDKTDATE